MGQTLTLIFNRVKRWRVVYDDESPDWNHQSRTLQLPLSQAPSVYGYSTDLNYKPNDYRVFETGMEAPYYELNNYNVNGDWDGLGHDRCESFLFKDDTALYNGSMPGDRGFPKRELLTMSGNILEELGWEYDNQARKYLRFKTITPFQGVSSMTHKNSPELVHIFTIVQFRDGRTLTIPKINRDGYLYYYLISPLGYGYMPERFVKRN